MALSYTEAWCSHDAGRVADHYAPGGTIAINGGEPAGIAEVAQSFVAAFPDIEVFMDDLVFKDDVGRVPLDVHRHERRRRASGCASPASRSGTIRCRRGSSPTSQRHATTRPRSDRQLRDGASSGLAHPAALEVRAEEVLGAGRGHRGRGADLERERCCSDDLREAVDPSRRPRNPSVRATRAAIGSVVPPPTVPTSIPGNRTTTFRPPSTRCPMPWPSSSYRPARGPVPSQRRRRRSQTQA